MNKYEQYVEKKLFEYGNKFDSSNLAKQFIPYFNDGTRIKVETAGMTITGTVGVTTGWKPSFILMRTSRSIGSSWILGNREKIIAVQYGRKYKVLIDAYIPFVDSDPMRIGAQT